MNSQDRNKDPVLDRDLLDSVSESFDAEPADEQRVDRLRARIMQRIDDETGGQRLFDTIRSGEGQWIEIMPNVHKKCLSVDPVTGTESYLLRMAPGATVPAHTHQSNELCYVIEGDLRFGDLLLEAGDYHFAYKGSRHGDSGTRNGTLLFLQSVSGYQPTG